MSDNGTSRSAPRRGALLWLVGEAGEVRRGGVDSHAGVHPKGTCFAARTGSE